MLDNWIFLATGRVLDESEMRLAKTKTWSGSLINPKGSQRVISSITLSWLDNSALLLKILETSKQESMCRFKFVFGSKTLKSVWFLFSRIDYHYDKLEQRKVNIKLFFKTIFKTIFGVIPKRLNPQHKPAKPFFFFSLKTLEPVVKGACMYTFCIL